MAWTDPIVGALVVGAVAVGSLASTLNRIRRQGRESKDLDREAEELADRAHEIYTRPDPTCAVCKTCTRAAATEPSFGDGVQGRLELAALGGMVLGAGIARGHTIQLCQRHSFDVGRLVQAIAARAPSSRE